MAEARPDLANDVSGRSWQLQHGGQWVKGKSFDTFCPIGPWLVTADEVADPLELGLGCMVNGEARQNGSTETMIFPVPVTSSGISARS